MKHFTLQRSKKDTQLFSILKCEVELYKKRMIYAWQDVSLPFHIVCFILLLDVQLLQNLDWNHTKRKSNGLTVKSLSQVQSWRRDILPAYSFPVECSLARTTWQQRKSWNISLFMIMNCITADSTHGWEGAFSKDSTKLKVLRSFLVLLLLSM